MGNLTYSTKLIFDNKTDENKIFSMLKSANFCWNECSKVKFNKVPKNSIIDLHKNFYKKFRKSNKHIPAQLVIAAQRSVLSIYRSIKSNKHKIEKPCEKEKLSLRLDHNNYWYKNNILSLSSLKKRVKCKLYIYPKLKELMKKYTFCDPLLFVKNNQIWIALTFKIPEIPSKPSMALGIDLGCRINAATSEGNLYVDKQFNGRKRALRHLKDCLKSKASKGSKSAQKHLNKLRHKERNINHNFSHNLTKKIIEDTKADVLVLENLKSIKVKKDFKNKNRISQVPFYQFKQLLTYKALQKQKTVIEVCPSWTSQIDHKTNKKDGERKGRRYYSKSGLIYDSDINAAINIAKRSKLPISLGYAQTYGQAKIKTPIVNACIYKSSIEDT